MVLAADIHCRGAAPGAALDRAVRTGQSQATGPRVRTRASNHQDDTVGLSINIRTSIGRIAIAPAIVSAFVAIPYAAADLVVPGVVPAFGAQSDAHVRISVSAVARNVLGHAFEAAPGAGRYLAAIVANVGALPAGVAATIVFRNMQCRLMQ